MGDEKRIDLLRSVYELCEAHPQIKQILADIGFTDITRPGMLMTAGRFMTIPKGAGMKGIDLELIKARLRAHGFDMEEGQDEQGN